MQKNRSFKKPFKPSRQASHNSSKAILQLSSITANSRDKSGLLNNFTDRKFHHPSRQNENQHDQHSYTKNNSTSKINENKKQSYVKKNVSLSNKILKEIMDFSNSLYVKKSADDSSNLQKDHNLLIFSKNDLKKSKAISQTKQSKKLILCDAKQDYQKTLSKSKSSYVQAMKGEPIICSIKIHPMQQRSNYSKSQKMQSFQNKRSSFSSKRSSIHLYQQDMQPQAQFNDLKRQFLIKTSKDLQDQSTHQYLTNQCQTDHYMGGQDRKMFLKKAETNKYDLQSTLSRDKQNMLFKKTREDQSQITPRQKQFTKQNYLLKLDQLTIEQEDIKKEAFRFINWWQQIITKENKIEKYKKYFPQTKKKYQSVQQLSYKLKSELKEANKSYLFNKRNSNYNVNSQRQHILVQIQRVHSDVKKKVFKKDLEEMMVFNMKVVLPSSEMTESSISCLDSQLSAAIMKSNFSILQIYQQLMKQKGCKKYGMILKKQINNMNIYDSRTMNEYLKRLYELQISFNKVNFQDPQIQIDYLDKIQNLIQKIQQVDGQLSKVKTEKNNLQRDIKQSQQSKAQSVEAIQNLLGEMSSSIFTEYKIFQTGKVDAQCFKMPIGSDLNQSFSSNSKTIQEFKELVSKKYQSLFVRYKQIKAERKLLQDSLKVYS